MSGGFVDLRLNQQNQTDESFWPSFTDIMTVIVMIFLLSMVTLLLRNMDLVDQLRASLDAERSASEQVQSTSDVNYTLRKRLQDLEKESAMIRMRLMDLSEEHSQSLVKLENSNREVTSLQQERDNLSSERDALSEHRNSLQRDLAARSSELESLTGQLTASQHEVSTLKSYQTTQLDKIELLEGEFNNLKIKYNKLIRPARSTKGRYVVEVRYRKLASGLSIEMKSPSDRQLTAVNEQQMHQRLSAIKKKQGENLYVKIVFPHDNDLSYTEAWSLTESLLRAYDYYYQE